MKWIAVVAVVLFVLTTAASGSGVSADKTTKLVMKSCTVCHKTKRICKAIGQKDEADWRQTVATMVAKGAPLSDEMARQVADFLSGLTEKAPPLCP